jgi:hypothetical protein
VFKSGHGWLMQTTPARSLLQFCIVHIFISDTLPPDPVIYLMKVECPLDVTDFQSASTVHDVVASATALFPFFP